MTSKKRRAARAWMSEERKRADRATQEAATRAARGAAERTRAELTRMIPRDDENTLYPSGKLTEPMLRVAARFDLQPRELLDPGEFYTRADMMRFRQVEVFALTAQQHALVLPDGTKVVWWGWELGR